LVKNANMAEAARSPGFLLTLAAESAAPAMAGCAEAFNAAGKAPVLDKANEHFAPRIAARWFDWLRDQGPQDQRAAIESLGGILAPEARREATAAIRRLIPFANPSDEAILIDYLTVLPGRIKLSLQPDIQTGRRLLPPDWTLAGEQTLLALLVPGRARSQASSTPSSSGPPILGTSANPPDLVGQSGSKLRLPMPPASVGPSNDTAAALADKLALESAAAMARAPTPTAGAAMPSRPHGTETRPHPTSSSRETVPAFAPTPVPASLSSLGLRISTEVAEKNGRARKRMLQARLEKGRPSREAFDRRRVAELDKLKNTLAHQIEQNAWKEAHLTVAAMLKINPEDPDALDTQAFIEEQLATAGPGDEILHFTEHRAWVNCATFMPDGRRILSASGGLRIQGKLKEDADRSMRLWDSLTGQTIQHFAGLTFIVNCLAITPDGSRVLVGSREGDVYLWDVDTGKIVRRFESAMKMVTSLAVSPDGRNALSGSDDKYLRVWDMATGRRSNSLRGHSKGITCVAYSQDGRFAMTGSADRSLRLWDIQNARVIRSFEGHSKPVLCLALSPDSRFVLSGSSGSSLRMWDAQRGKIVRRFEGHTDQVHSVAISPNGKLALSGSTDHTARLWDIEEGKEIRKFQGHTDEVRCVVFSPDGSQALTASRDTTIRLWRVPQS
jgi:hypothetical protein